MNSTIMFRNTFGITKESLINIRSPSRAQLVKALKGHLVAKRGKHF